MAEGIIAAITLFYNHNTQNAVLGFVIERLQKENFNPKKSTIKYLNERYKNKRR